MAIGSDGYRLVDAFVTTDLTRTLTPGAGRVGLYFSGLPTRTIYSGLNLCISGQVTGGPGVLRVWLVCGDPRYRPEDLPLPFSGARLPGSLPYEINLGTMTLEAGTYAALPVVWGDPNPGNSLGAPTLYPFLHHSLFSGVLPLELEWTSSSVGSLDFHFARNGDGPKLVVANELPFLTGLDGAQYAQGMSRVDECPVTGKRGLREGWVARGWDNALCDPSANDPADYVESYVHYERPPLNDAG